MHWNASTCLMLRLGLEGLAESRLRAGLQCCLRGLGLIFIDQYLKFFGKSWIGRANRQTLAKDGPLMQQLGPRQLDQFAFGSPHPSCSSSHCARAPHD